MQTNSLETQVKNLDGKRNYVILETEGEGNFIGCNQSVTHFQGVSFIPYGHVGSSHFRHGGAKGTT